MGKVIRYSFLLIFGMIFSQSFDLGILQPYLTEITLVCLSYIMMEVGLEFSIDKNNLQKYVKDYLVAMTAAAFPWIFCSLYFYYFLDADFRESILIGRFAAPTSAGVLFAMLSAAGLASTWLFKKARILAIFDDLDTILFMIPLQIMFTGMRPNALLLVIVIVILCWAAYRFLHQLRIPVSGWWLLLYSIGVTAACYFLEYGGEIELEVLLPAFVFGCLIYHPKVHEPVEDVLAHKTLDSKTKSWVVLDISLKHTFMFLVGCSLPKLHLGEIGIKLTLFHVLILTLLSNVGKMFPSLCYKDEATLRERIAVSVAMFPRGEVGAGVLLVAIGFQLNQNVIALGGLSLALNLLLTGVFILTVIRLTRPNTKSQ